MKNNDGEVLTHEDVKRLLEIEVAAYEYRSAEIEYAQRYKEADKAAGGERNKKRAIWKEWSPAINAKRRSAIEKLDVLLGLKEDPDGL